MSDIEMSEIKSVTDAVETMNKNFEIYKDKCSELESIAEAFETTCKKLQKENDAFRSGAFKVGNDIAATDSIRNLLDACKTLQKEKEALNVIIAKVYEYVSFVNGNTQDDETALRDIRELLKVKGNFSYAWI